MLSGVMLSNGLDWTDDNRQMYYIDSATQSVDVFEFDPERGLLGERRRLISIPANEALPDGMTVDAEGGIGSRCTGAALYGAICPTGGWSA